MGYETSIFFARMRLFLLTLDTIYAQFIQICVQIKIYLKCV